jgi:hypothetical protein
MKKIENPLTKKRSSMFDIIEQFINPKTSRQNLLHTDEKYRLVSFEGEITYKNYIKVDNSDLEPEEVAKMIQEKFSL